MRHSAQTLISLNESVPESLEICWHCLARGDLHEALNEITAQGLMQRKAYDEASERLENEETVDVSEHELLELEEALNHELEMAAILDEEYRSVENDLKAALAENASFQKTTLMHRNGLLMAQNALESIESKVYNLNQQLSVIPKSTLGLWEDFFQIEDHHSFASICGVPLAYRPTFDNELMKSRSPSEASPWNATNWDAQCISAAMTLASALLGRLTNTLPPPPSDFMLDRPYRVLTTPTSIETRNAQPRLSYSLVPFVNGKLQDTWPKALRLFADSVSLIFRHWKQPPPYHLPSPGSEDAFYALDFSKSHQWNEKMRFLLLNIKHLVTLRFPPSAN